MFSMKFDMYWTKVEESPSQFYFYALSQVGSDLDFFCHNTWDVVKLPKEDSNWGLQTSREALKVPQRRFRFEQILTPKRVEKES